MAVAPSQQSAAGSSSPTVMSPLQPASPSDYASGSSPHRVSADQSMPRLILPHAVNYCGNLLCRTVFVHSVICTVIEYIVFCLIFMGF